MHFDFENAHNVKRMLRRAEAIPAVLLENFHLLAHDKDLKLELTQQSSPNFVNNGITKPFPSFMGPKTNAKTKTLSSTVKSKKIVLD